MFVDDPSAFPPGGSKLALPFELARLELRPFCTGVLGVTNGVLDADAFSPAQLLANVIAVTSETVVNAVELVLVSKSMLQKLLLTLSFVTRLTSLLWFGPGMKQNLTTFQISWFGLGMFIMFKYFSPK